MNKHLLKAAQLQAEANREYMIGHIKQCIDVWTGIGVLYGLTLEETFSLMRKHSAIPQLSWRLFPTCSIDTRIVVIDGLRWLVELGIKLKWPGDPVRTYRLAG